MINVIDFIISIENYLLQKFHYGTLHYVKYDNKCIKGKDNITKTPILTINEVLTATVNSC